MHAGPHRDTHIWLHIYTDTHTTSHYIPFKTLTDVTSISPIDFGRPAVPNRESVLLPTMSMTV